MLKFIAKKLLKMIPMMLVISFMVFAALQFTGLDPISYSIPPDMADPAQIEALREEMGFNDPLIIRYVRWLGDVLTGNFGYSIVRGIAVTELISQRMTATIELSAWTLLLSTVLGVGLGYVSAIKQNGIIDYISRIIGVVGQSVPQFFFGIFLIQVFALKLGWFPTGGRISPENTGYSDIMWHMLLPLLALTFAMLAVLVRYTRNSMLDIMNSDYIKTAISKGLPPWKVYFKHAFRNSLKPVMVVLCFRLPILIGGSVVIENVFNWPGIGSVFTQAVVSGDYPILMAILLMISAAMLVASMLVDIFTALLDPRVRFDGF